MNVRCALPPIGLAPWARRRCPVRARLAGKERGRTDNGSIHWRARSPPSVRGAARSGSSVRRCSAHADSAAGRRRRKGLRRSWHTVRRRRCLLRSVCLPRHRAIHATGLWHLRRRGGDLQQPQLGLLRRAQVRRFQHLRIRDVRRERRALRERRRLLHGVGLPVGHLRLPVRERLHGMHRPRGRRLRLDLFRRAILRRRRSLPRLSCRRSVRLRRSMLRRAHLSGGRLRRAAGVRRRRRRLPGRGGLLRRSDLPGPGVQHSAAVLRTDGRYLRRGRLLPGVRLR
jgi:hypothetical protein